MQATLPEMAKLVDLSVRIITVCRFQSLCNPATIFILYLRHERTDRISWIRNNKTRAQCLCMIIGLPVVIVSTGCESLWSLTGKLSTTTNTFPRAVPTHRQGLTKLSAKYNGNLTSYLNYTFSYLSQSHFDITQSYFVSSFKKISTRGDWLPYHAHYTTNIRYQVT